MLKAEGGTGSSLHYVQLIITLFIDSCKLWKAWQLALVEWAYAPPGSYAYDMYTSIEG